LEVRLHSSEPAVLAQALIDLGRAGPSSPADIVAARDNLANPAPAVHLAAISAVTQLHDDAAVPLLAADLNSAEPGDKANAHAALMAIAGSDIGGMDAGAWRDWDRAIVERTNIGIAQVRAAIGSGNEDTARCALHPLLMQR